MFKKPLSDLKTSATLRSSDQRKLKQRIAQTFNLEAEEAVLLVPDGLQSVKFSTHLDEHGVAYLSPDGDPLWFTVGKGSDDLIPTVYTLWKKPDLLPTLTTPSAVIPVLIGGADLMIPGVVQHPRNVTYNQLASVSQYLPDRTKHAYPLAVGAMAVGADQLQAPDAKGKAVLIFHTWKDKLWELGSRGGPPDPIDVASTAEGAASEQPAQGDGSPPVADVADADASGSPQDSGSEAPLSPDEVSTLLRSSLLQAIQTTLSSLPTSAFPIPATTFYTTHLLPSRPAHMPSPTPVDIKHSSFKSLSAFLKAVEKEGLLTLKQVKGDAVITGVKPNHADVVAHRAHRTLKMEEEKREVREKRVREEEGKKGREVAVVELWKPHQTTIRFFEAEEVAKDSTALYTASDIRALVNDYVAKKNLVNQVQQQYVNVGSDDVLRSALSGKGRELAEFMKREELVKELTDKMQAWYTIQPEGKDPIVKKGKVRPVSVLVKMRLGRKACTLVTGFEAFFLEADNLAEELRRSCASSTAVDQLPGKNAGMEVMVQGKQIKAVTDLLMAKGVPAKWIESADQTGKKK